MIKEYLEVGKIVGTHGIKGECRVELWCDGGDFFSCFTTLYLDKDGKKSISVKSRPHKNIALMKIKGIDNIDDAIINKLKNDLTDVEKSTALLEAKTATSWIYEYIKQICKGDE